MAPNQFVAKQKEQLMDIKDRIQAAMAWRGIDSQSELARRLGTIAGRSYSRQTVNNWLQGKVANMSHAALFDLAAVLEVNARWLAEGEPHSLARPVWLSPDQQKLLALAEGLEKADPAYYERWIDNGQWELDRAIGPSRQNPYPLVRSRK